MYRVCRRLAARDPVPPKKPHKLRRVMGPRGYVFFNQYGPIMGPARYEHAWLLRAEGMKFATSARTSMSRMSVPARWCCSLDAR